MPDRSCVKVAREFVMVCLSFLCLESFAYSDSTFSNATIVGEIDCYISTALWPDFRTDAGLQARLYQARGRRQR